MKPNVEPTSTDTKRRTEDSLAGLHTIRLSPPYNCIMQTIFACLHALVFSDMRGLDMGSLMQGWTKSIN
jgi:hypothetical protein